MSARRNIGNTGRAGRKPGRWRLLALLLLLPYLFFGLIPAQSMLAADAQGRMMVVLCGHDSPVEMAVAADGTLTPVSELGAHASDNSCGWAAHGQPLLSLVGAQIAPPHLASATMDLTPAIGASLHDFFAVLTAARDPPVIA